MKIILIPTFYRVTLQISIWVEQCLLTALSTCAGCVCVYEFSCRVVHQVVLAIIIQASITTYYKVGSM